MKTSLFLSIVFAAGLLAAPAFAQETAASPAAATADVATATEKPSGIPSEAEMMKMMAEMGKVTDNHKLLGELAGTWSYTVKMWMDPDPNAKPQEYKGTATRKPMLGGRFYQLDVSGKMKMPGEDGKMKEVDFKGMGLEGYDNAKQKFTGTWIDSMGTGMLFSEGTYDPASKTFTYSGEYQMTPSMKMPIREIIRITDKDHHVFEWYENRGGKDVKTMEIAYTRKK